MKKMIGLALVAAFALSLVQAHADGTEIIAGPGDQYTNSFVTPISVTPVGGPLTFGNIDVAARGFESDAAGPSTNSWCKYYLPQGKPCPLFWAHTIDVIYHTTSVLGLNQLVAGTTYGFHDSLNPNVKGILIAV